MAFASLLLSSCLMIFDIAASPVALAQDEATVESGDTGGGLDAEALKVLVAPVAFYPDDVLAIVLPASTTGLQIVQAQQYLDKHKTNTSLQPNPDWDPSVLALLNYPEVIARLNADLDWTQRLGDAVINQQADVMDMIQQIRDEAVAAGYLKSDANTVVTQTEQTVVITAANPEVIYVPNYDPQVIVQQTYVSAPPPVYYPPAPPYYSPAATFFTGVVVGSAIAYGLDWHNDNIHVDHHGNYNGNGNYKSNNDVTINNNFNNSFDRNNGNGNNVGNQAGTTNWQAKRPATKPANKPAAGLAPVNRAPTAANKKPNATNKLNTTNNAATNNKALTNNKAPTGAAKTNQPKNQVGNTKATGKTPGGLGNVTTGTQVKKQDQRGTQSLQNKKAPAAATTRKAPAGNGGAFGGSSTGGAKVKAQQSRGNGSRGQMLRR